LLKKDGSIEQEVYTKANVSWKLASIIESATLYQNLLILMCANEDKVEIVDNKTFKTLCEPVRGMGIPRYCAVYNNIAYVTCTNNWNPDENGHVCLIDLTSKKLIKKITVKGIPEGIKEVAGSLYVATGNGIAVINATTNEVTRHLELFGQNVELSGQNENLSVQKLEAKHIVSDFNGKLWVSFTSNVQTGIASFDIQSNRFSSFIPLKNMPYTGNIDIAPDGKTLFYLTADGIVGGQGMETVTAIYPFDIENEKASETPLIAGTGFYGFNVNPLTGDIYTANVNGFITNSVMYIYNKLDNSWYYCLTQ
jgi:hypothetical protein